MLLEVQKLKFFQFKYLNKKSFEEFYYDIDTKNKNNLTF